MSPFTAAKALLAETPLPDIDNAGFAKAVWYHVDGDTLCPLQYLFLPIFELSSVVIASFFLFLPLLSPDTRT